MNRRCEGLDGTSPGASATPIDPAWRERLALVVDELAATAIARDKAGGTALHERQVLRDSGLLALSVPVEYGGLGGTWADVFDVVRQLANVDPSLAHLFGFHHLQLATARLFGPERQWSAWLRESVTQRWFWGNALNARDIGARATRVDRDDFHGYVFDGIKRFCSGARDSDRLVVSALAPDDRVVIAVVPTARDGIAVHDDWDNIGQRQTDSGTVTLTALHVRDDELLDDPGPLATPRASLRPMLSQLILTHLYLGIGQGALAQARAYVQEQGRPWPGANVAGAGQDPYVLARFGDFWVGLDAADAVAARAVARFDQAWSLGDSLDATTRSDVALAVVSAKITSARASLDVAHRLFEVTGARATRAALGLDRFWRNVRVHTLHDPIDYKLRELGEWALNGKRPAPGNYS